MISARSTIRSTTGLWGAGLALVAMGCRPAPTMIQLSPLPAPCQLRATTLGLVTEATIVKAHTGPVRTVITVLRNGRATVDHHDQGGPGPGIRFVRQICLPAVEAERRFAALDAEHRAASTSDRRVAEPGEHCVTAMRHGDGTRSQRPPKDCAGDPPAVCANQDPEELCPHRAWAGAMHDRLFELLRARPAKAACAEGICGLELLGQVEPHYHQLGVELFYQVAIHKDGTWRCARPPRGMDLTETEGGLPNSQAAELLTWLMSTVAKADQRSPASFPTPEIGTRTDRVKLLLPGGHEALLAEPAAARVRERFRAIGPKLSPLCSFPAPPGE